MENFELMVLAVATYDEIMAKSIENHVVPSDEEVYKQIMARIKDYKEKIRSKE